MDSPDLQLRLRRTQTRTFAVWFAAYPALESYDGTLWPVLACGPPIEG
jgi:hypothetical protein